MVVVGPDGVVRPGDEPLLPEHDVYLCLAERVTAHPLPRVRRPVRHREVRRAVVGVRPGVDGLLRRVREPVEGVVHRVPLAVRAVPERRDELGALDVRLYQGEVEPGVTGDGARRRCVAARLVDARPVHPTPGLVLALDRDGVPLDESQCGQPLVARLGPVREGQLLVLQGVDELVGQRRPTHLRGWRVAHEDDLVLAGGVVADDARAGQFGAHVTRCAVLAHEEQRLVGLVGHGVGVAPEDAALAVLRTTDDLDGHRLLELQPADQFDASHRPGDDGL